MLRRFSKRRVVGFFTLDWLGTLAVLFLAALFRSLAGGLPRPLSGLLLALQIPFNHRPLTDGQHVLPGQVALVVALLWPLVFVLASVYDGRRSDTLRAELMNVLAAIVAATLILAGMLYLTYNETSRVLFVVFFVLDACLLLVSRVVFWLYRRGRRATMPGRRHSPVLIAGAGRVGLAAARQIRKFACADLDLIGYADDDLAKQGHFFDGLPVLGGLDDIERLVQEAHVQNAVVALPLEAHDRLIEVCKRLQKSNVHVHVIPDLFALSFPNAALDGFGGIPVIDLGQPSIHGWRRGFKRAFDVVVSALILAALWPALLAIALAIKLDSPGPVIYRQRRVGENGRPFTLLKFRSMRTGADTRLHQEYVTRLIRENLGVSELGEQRERNSGSGTLKMESDPRITRVGHFIRKTSLDELPQLFNVLRGEMSLVGPRPPIPYEVAVYQDWHHRRLEAIPGITGLWQVEGRNQVSFDEMVRMDLKYIERQSFWLDVKILLQTPLSALRGRGAG